MGWTAHKTTWPLAPSAGGRFAALPLASEERFWIGFCMKTVALLLGSSILLTGLLFWAYRDWQQKTGADEALELQIVPFQHQVVDPFPLTGLHCCTDVLALGDLNGDGRPDIVLGAQESASEGLVWYQNPTWQRHAVARGEFTTDGQVADIDGDGDQDIVIGRLETGLTWYENLDHGVAWRPQFVGAGYVHDLQTGDLDGDGQLEIATCDKRELGFWRRTTAGWVRHTLWTGEGEGIALDDLDGDSDLDVVFGARWLENPGGSGDSWIPHLVAENWPAATRVRTSDIDGDGQVDIVLTASEGPGRVSWFKLPRSGRGPAVEHSLSAARFHGTHSLVVADLDNDGDADVAIAEMHTSPEKRVMIFLNDETTVWRSQIVGRNGSHNMQAADLDGDGDIDLVGKNYAGAGRAVEYWRNLSRDNFGAFTPSRLPFLAPGWEYVAIDEHRDADQRGKMGLLGADVNRDGRLDLVAGTFLYINPGGSLAAPWRRTRVGIDVDIFFATDIDHDDHPDLVGARRDLLLWLEAADQTCQRWKEKPVAEIPDARTQGYVTAQIEAGGKDELVFTRGTTLSYVAIPAQPDRDLWPRMVISGQAEEEGVAVADVDRDGRLDVVATLKGGQRVAWWKNPGTRAGTWTEYPIGTGADRHWLDRVSVADINQDGLLDVVASEETQDWAYNASVYWFEAPRTTSLATPWRRHSITVLRSINSLDVRDMNGDGAPDVILAEHTDLRSSQGAPNNLTAVFVNEGRGSRWIAQPVEAGPHSSHLGARVFDLDADGRPDIVSLGWNQFKTLHLWWHRGSWPTVPAVR